MWRTTEIGVSLLCGTNEMYTSKGIAIYCGSCLENGTLPVDIEKQKTSEAETAYPCSL